MKPSIFLFLVIFISSFFCINNVSAKTVKYSNPDIKIEIYKTKKNDAGEAIGREYLFTVDSGIESVLITPIGKILRIVTFQIKEGHPILEYANPVAHVKMTAWIDFDGDGVEEVELVDKSAILTQNGKFKIVYHGDAL